MCSRTNETTLGVKYDKSYVFRLLAAENMCVLCGNAKQKMQNWTNEMRMKLNKYACFVCFQLQALKNLKFSFKIALANYF